MRPGNVLVMVRNYNTLYNLNSTLDQVDTHKQDVITLHLRFLNRSDAGEYELEPEQFFSSEEQTLFTRALALAEKKGKSIHLAVAAATEKWDAILRAAQSLQSSVVVLGVSPNHPVGALVRSEARANAHHLLTDWAGAGVLPRTACAAPHAEGS